MNLAGFGDLTAHWTAPADWYLACAVGMDDSYHPAPVEMLREGSRGLLEDAAGLRDREPAALDRLARVLTLSGIPWAWRARRPRSRARSISLATWSTCPPRLATGH